MKSYLTIEEIMKRKHFETVEVVAGQSGLHRFVKWVHVVEVIQIRKLLNGHELILTTGLGWKDDKEIFLSFLTQLIECNAAGLCIELGTHATYIPEEVIELANEHQFPIIIFHQEVPFVAITQDIHSLLINQHYQMISDLENYSQQLNKKLLEIEDYEEILHFFQKYIDLQVIATFNEKDMQFVPPLIEREQQEYRALIASDSSNMSRHPVQILGQQYAELIVVPKQRELNEFDLLIIDRTVTALAQLLLRNLYVEEKKTVEESAWMTDWLEGNHSEQAIREHLTYMDPQLKLQGGVVCICKMNSSAKSSNMDGTYFKLFCRNILEQHGFHVFTTEWKHDLIFILGNKRTKKGWRDRLNEGLKRIENVDFNAKLKLSSLSFGVGKYVNRVNDMHLSYKTAKEALRLQDILSDKNKSYFYEDLHLYRIISLVHKHSDLTDVVMEYLAPVIEYDQKYNGRLMETLKMYLACQGSKQETAKKLFVVRQTLYHRIEKIEKLLGEDFMISEKRLALEFMIVAYEYLQTTEKNNTRYHIYDL
nr:PucR family transcriptional regulator ligand-binding domain-containing protein [Anaerobacillus alkaliphilus]